MTTVQDRAGTKEPELKRISLSIEGWNETPSQSRNLARTTSHPHAATVVMNRPGCSRPGRYGRNRDRFLARVAGAWTADARVDVGLLRASVVLGTRPSRAARGLERQSAVGTRSHVVRLSGTMGIKAIGGVGDAAMASLCVTESLASGGN
jgi:hypothetical protein